MKIIYGGHWDNPPEGWTSIPEHKQDIAKRLNLEDNSVDIIFTEHVMEHLPFESAIHFMKECLRVLKPNGVMRTAAPMLDKLIKFENGKLAPFYADCQLMPYYHKENFILKDLGIDGIAFDPMPFMFDSLLKKHNHQFVWTSGLMSAVKKKIGFMQVNVVEPGQTNFKNVDCLERTIRGIDVNKVVDAMPDFTHRYDPETLVVEAIK